MFRIYTHLPLGEVQHNITNIIEPLLFESNNHRNRATILRWLQSRFHRAQMLDEFDYDGEPISITHEII